jgi:hypothetical protein
MRSVAADHRRRTREQVLAMPALERVRLALRLGDEDLERFSASSGRPREEALRRLRLTRARGRRPSACASLESS